MSSREAGGLFVGEQRVPLRGVAIDARVRGVACHVTVAQRYQNGEKVPVEAVYSFPLDEGSAVCAFEVEVGGKRIVGKVVEKEKAFEQYDEAMAAGHGAFLVDQDRPNIFTASVGNLLPGQEAVVRLSYVSELDQAGDHMRLLIPTTISPRYIPAAQARTIDPAELDHVAPPTLAGGVPYGLRLTADIEMPGRIRGVECPSHPVRLSLTDRHARVELVGADIQLDQDFVLSVEVEGARQPSVVVARDLGGERIAMLNLFPDLSSLARSPSEIIFLLDRSGSMQGESIEQARNALLLCLRSLEEGDRFNIVGFGSSHELLFPESVPYSQATLDQATRHVQAVDADLGGTELLSPLRALVGVAKEAGMTRQILLLTDGEVGNEQECIDVVAAGQARIFTFGIGRGASEFLVRGLARASRAAAEFIFPGERIEPKVLRQFGRVVASGLRNIRVDWGTVEADLVAPAELPPLFHGDRVTLFARLRRGGPSQVAIVADGPSGPMRFPVLVDVETAVDDPAVPVLMARRAIRDLEEGRGSGLGGSAQQGRRERRVREAIVDLGCRYGLMSSATSFVAVEERPSGTQTIDAQLRRVPVALTRGWHGTQSDRGLTRAGAAMGSMLPPSLMSAAPSRSRMMPGAPPPPPACPSPAPAKPKVASSVALGRSAKKMDMAKDMAASPVMACEEGRDPLMTLTLGQQADGSWSLDAGLAAVAGCPLAVLEKAAGSLASASVTIEIARRVVATLVALRSLRASHKDREDEWRMLAAKADRWLARTKVASPTGAPLDAWLTTLIATH